MPPKFKLAIDVEPEQKPETNPNMQSLRLNDHSITVLTNSYNPVSFTSEGMRKNDGMHFYISEKDIKVLKKLGQGASSTVHKGFLMSQNRFIAIKKINIFEKETRHQMLNDIKALCDANKVPGLVTFFGAFSAAETGQISIVLEYLDGGSLADVLAKVKRIPENVLSKITHKILHALNYLHKQKHMVHRDIKPANILMNLNGEPKITDFGISAFIDSTLAVCQTFLGTVTYMSPERINNQHYSFPADIWSLGLALLECATGQYPYDASVGPLQLMIQVLDEDVPLPPADKFSPEFIDFVRQCMRKEQFERPDAEQLMQHPFITKHIHEAVDLKAFMQCCFDPHDKLDEIAIVFAYNYYALLSAGGQRLRDLAPLYSESSVLLYDGERCVGREAILNKLATVTHMHSGFKIVHAVKEVDCQPMGMSGSALVHVHGELQAPALTQPPAPFYEAFLLAQIAPGEYYVANQVFRLAA